MVLQTNGFAGHVAEKTESFTAILASESIAGSVLNQSHLALAGMRGRSRREARRRSLRHRGGARALRPAVAALGGRRHRGRFGATVFRRRCLLEPSSPAPAPPLPWGTETVTQRRLLLHEKPMRNGSKWRRSFILRCAGLTEWVRLTSSSGVGGMTNPKSGRHAGGWLCVWPAGGRA